MIRILLLYGPKPCFCGSQHHAGVVKEVLRKGLGKHGLKKAGIIILLHAHINMQYILHAHAGGLQHGRYSGADNVASRFRIARMPVSPKARQTCVCAIEYDADHASMEVISTLV